MPPTCLATADDVAQRLAAVAPRLAQRGKHRIQVRRDEKGDGGAMSHERLRESVRAAQQLRRDNRQRAT